MNPKKGCGERLVKGNIILSIMCGDYNLDKQDFIYCGECENKEVEEC